MWSTVSDLGTISICEGRSIVMIYLTPVYELIMKGLKEYQTSFILGFRGRYVKGGRRRLMESPPYRHQLSQGVISRHHQRSMNRLAAVIRSRSIPSASQLRARTIMSTSSQAGPGPSSLRNLKPPSRQGMQELDRNAFRLDLPILSIKVKASQIDRYRSNPIFKT